MSHRGPTRPDPPTPSPATGDRERRREMILTAPVTPTLLRMAGPMVIGLVAIMGFNLVDTYFVGQLGALELAAMSFTFPVIFVVMSISFGLSIATAAVVSRAIGQGDRTTMRRLTTHALILANLLVALLAGVGLVTIEPLFRLLGAGDQVIPLIEQYMVPWYIGVGFLVIPMVGNGGVRATGDTKTPSIIMIFAGVVNAALDPLLIFGLGPFPRLELQGAAVATVISRALTFVAALYILHHRERMIEWAIPKGRELMRSWRTVLYIGVPTTASKMLVPLAAGVLTRMVSQFGNEAVAAFGVGQRLEPMAMLGVGALGAAAVPFVGQNYGAGQVERVQQTMRLGLKLSLGWGLSVAALLALFAPQVAALFNDTPQVVHIASWFLYLVPVSYGLYGMGQLSIDAFNAVNQPLRAALLIGIRLFVLAIPLAWIGMQLWQVRGIFAGMAAANILIGVMAYASLTLFLRRRRADEGEQNT